MTNFTATLDGKKIGKGIDQFGAMVKGAMTLGHALMVSVALHAAKHGDVTLADRFITACDEGFRKNACKSWMIANGPFGWRKKEGDKPAGFTLNKDKAETLKAEITADEGKAIERLLGLKNAWESKPEAEFDGYDALVILQREYKKMERLAGEDDPSRKAKINVKGMQHVKRAIEAIVAERATLN